MKFFASVFNFSRGSFVDEVDTSTAVVRLRMAENEFPHSPQKFPSSCVWLQTGQVLMGVTPFLCWIVLVAWHRAVKFALVNGMCEGWRIERNCIDEMGVA